MHVFRLNRGRKGTSLVEIMIAMAIMAIVLIAFLSIMHSASQMSAVSKENAIALSILQSSMEEIYAPNYTNFFNTYFINAPPINKAPDPTTPLFATIQTDSGILGSMASLTVLLPRVQGTGLPLTAGERTVWNGIVSSFKKYPYTLPRTGRLTNEEIKLYLLPTADLYRAGAFNPSPLSTDHPYVDYMVEITWKDATGKMRSESITTRRSQ